MELLDSHNRHRLRRPIRSKRCNRKYTTIESRRQAKRLFTPEIKKLLKEWLIRRRENPYPNREEKKVLAEQTGLTYVQICNWFANWRRKLKNVGKGVDQKTWGDLIKTYNSLAEGNLEHFSICSEDSIWQELEVDESVVFRRKCVRETDECAFTNISKPTMIFRWLQSATNCKPCDQNYLFYYSANTAHEIHGCEELDAAETLTALANSSV